MKGKAVGTHIEIGTPGFVWRLGIAGSLNRARLYSEAGRLNEREGFQNHDLLMKLIAGVHHLHDTEGCVPIVDPGTGKQIGHYKISRFELEHLL